MGRVISICGNIGSGKSTLIKTLSENQHIYKVVQEPVSEMNDLLCKFYADMSKWAFHLQCKVLLLYRTIYNNCYNENSYIIERSPIESKCIFAQALYDSKFLTTLEYSLYNELYDALHWYPDLIIYVQVEPEVCMKRIEQRSRDCENDINIDYIKQLHDLYEKFYERNKHSTNVLVVDGNQSIDEVYQACSKYINI